jgi:hypothetical protein
LAVWSGTPRNYGATRDLQFLLDRYKWELDRKDKISAAVNVPVTLLILVSGLLATLFPKLKLTAPHVVVPVVVLYLAAVGFGIASLTWFIRA